jgi:tRNA threonylcarbamoyladenosine biosynthesis protein TsaB
MPNILLLETATEVCSIALYTNGGVAALREELDCKSHISVITLMIEDCLNSIEMNYSALDAVAISGGPGSYTSLRTGASVAKGLCFALDIPLIAIDTLQTLAWGAQQTVSEFVIHIPMLDARRNEVWLNAFDHNCNSLGTAQPLILDNDGLQQYLDQFPVNSKFILSGNGVLKIKDENISKNAYICSVKKNSAQFLGSFAVERLNANLTEDLARYNPVYQKPPNITMSQQPNFTHI